MSMNLAMRIDGRLDHDEIVLYQTDTTTTLRAIRGDAYEVYASFVREIFSDDLSQQSYCTRLLARHRGTTMS